MKLITLLTIILLALSSSFLYADNSEVFKAAYEECCANCDSLSEWHSDAYTSCVDKCEEGDQSCLSQCDIYKEDMAPCYDECHDKYVTGSYWEQTIFVPDNGCFIGSVDK